MRTKLVGLSVVTSVVTSLVAVTAYAQSAPSEADRLFEDGRKLMAAKQPAAACTKFEASIKLDPSAAGTMLNLGLCYEQTNRPHSALVWFRRAQARASETNLPSQEQAAKDHTRALATIVPVVTLTFTVPPPTGVQVTLDGVPVPATDWAHVEVDPGSHAIEVTAPGHQPLDQTVEVAAHGTQPVTIGALAGDEVRVKARGLRMIEIGGGVLALSLGYDLIERRNYYSNKDKGTSAGTTAANSAATRVRYIGTGVGAVGVAVAAVGAYFFFSSGHRTAESPERTAIVPAIGPDQLGLAITGGF
jgi:tetratricopeptide (TPR) repeat protein